jgi:hypothetical protein
VAERPRLERRQHRRPTRVFAVDLDSFDCQIQSDSRARIRRRRSFHSARCRIIERRQTGGGSWVGKYSQEPGLSHGECRRDQSKKNHLPGACWRIALTSLARFDHHEPRMSALSQAGLPGEYLERRKSEFKLTAFAATLCFTVGIAIPIYAQPAPTPDQERHQEPQSISKYPPPPRIPFPQRPQNAQQQPPSELALARDAMEKQKELIAALERRVKELEEELANCKAQQQKALPP